VHRSTFTRYSRVFSDVFALPKPASGQCVEGSSDELPVQFPGISSIDFERLLWILYPPEFGTYKPRTVDEWTSVLHLATRWEFESIRQLAIRELESLSIDPVNKIVLSRQFDISSPWTLAAYTEVCHRSDALTVTEARALGLETAMRIYQLREKLRSGRSIRPPRSGSGSPPRLPPAVSQYASENRRPVARRASLSHPPHNDRIPSPTSLSKTQCVKPPTRKLSDASRLIAEAFDLDL